MNKEEFYRSLLHPELLDDRSLPLLENILEEYPYFQTARLLHVKNLSNQGSIRYDKELKKTAVWTTDRGKLFYLLDKRVLLPVTESGKNFDDKKTTPDTAEADIDFSELTLVTDFFETQTSFNHLPDEENDELNQLIMTGSSQTATFFDVGDQINLEEFKNSFKKKKTEPISTIGSDDTSTRRNKLIDTFIVDQPRIVPRSEKETDHLISEIKVKEENPELITDTLAQIYIKQGFYEKAINAYEKLSLKYPEKNSYFADQIRKIKQIINNL
jgi:tetratricopeptide (TPR) repeat protein